MVTLIYMLGFCYKTFTCASLENHYVLSDLTIIGAVRVQINDDITT